MQLGFLLVIGFAVLIVVGFWGFSKSWHDERRLYNHPERFDFLHRRRRRRRRHGHGRSHGHTRPRTRHRFKEHAHRSRHRR